MSEPTAAILRAQDTEARAQAQLVFDRPVIIEAGAGTGKTQTLVSRIVAWCVGPGWIKAENDLRTAKTVSAATEITAESVATRVLRGVVAITFTEAAAAEMSTRLADVLAALERGDRPVGVLAEALDQAGDALCGRARALLGALDHIVIRTIHAYCRRLLGRYPIEARVHPNLRVDADASLQAEVVRTVVEAAIRRGYTEAHDDLLLDLAEYAIGPLQIEEAINALIAAGVHADVLATDPYTADRIGAAAATLEAELQALATITNGRAHKLGSKSLASRVGTALTDSLSHLRAHPIANVAALELFAGTLRELWPDNLIGRLREWGRDDIAAKERDTFGDSVDALSAAAGRLGLMLSSWRNLNPVLLNLARRAVAPLLEQAYRELHERGIATYTALLHDVRALLTSHPETAASIRRDIDQLLVDEFQDTDIVQCAIVHTLALDGPVNERPALFLVGDPKQSIYGWRSADLRAYDDFVADVLANGGIRHALSVNYRSQPTILEEVSRVVAPIMQRVEGLQPSFQPLIPAPLHNPTGNNGQPAVEYWIAVPWDADAQKPAGGRAADFNAIEAGALAADLRRLHDQEDVPWREVGVLFRSGTDLDTYLGALREVGVPYLVEGDRQFYERREVIDAAALFRTILEPHDQLALLTVLRSAMVGVPDAALLPLWSRGFVDAMAALADMSPAALKAVTDVIAAAASDLPSDIDGLEQVRGWEHNLIRAVASIGALRASFATEPIDVFVEDLRTRFLPEAIEATRRLGAYRLANLQRFFRQLLTALEQGEIDPQQVVRRLRTAIAQQVDAEEESPSDGVDEAIRVLTIHRAKGLDFRHVYVMQLHKEPGGAFGDPVDMSGQDQGEYRLFAGRTLAFWNVESRRTAVAAAEQVRTLYVAMTRAKSRLVLSGRWPTDRAPVATERARSQVRLLLARQPPPPDVDELMIAAAQEKRSSVDLDGVRWAFPALIGQREAATGVSGLAGIDITSVAASARRLAELRLDAIRHSARPSCLAVSAVASDALHEDTPPGDAMSRGTLRDARIARAAGIAVHSALEAWQPPDVPVTALHRQQSRLRNLLRAHVAGIEIDDALRAAESLLERFADSPCAAQLHAIADEIIARELPVLLPPSAEGPVGCFTGAIDLLYRDPRSGEMVVADYKTDRVETDAEIADHVATYRAQGAHYVRAVADALRLEQPPRFELWFLHPGRIEVVIP